MNFGNCSNCVHWSYAVLTGTLTSIDLLDRFHVTPFAWFICCCPFRSARNASDRCAADVPARDLGGRRAAAEREGELELVAEQLEDALGAVCTTRSEPPQRRPARQHRLRSERERLDDVRPAPDPAVHEHDEPIARGLDDLRQRVERGRDPVELTAAVIRDDDSSRSGL